MNFLRGIYGRRAVIRLSRRLQLHINLGCWLFLAGYGLGYLGGAREGGGAALPASPPEVALVGPPGRARIIFSKTREELGEVKRGDTATRRFSFTNQGSEELRVGGIVTSCHCTVARLAPDRLAPGQSGEVVAVFDSTGMQGPFERDIVLQTNDNTRPMVRLVLAGRVGR